MYVTWERSAGFEDVRTRDEKMKDNIKLTSNIWKTATQSNTSFYVFQKDKTRISGSNYRDKDWVQYLEENYNKDHPERNGQPHKTDLKIFVTNSYSISIRT